MNAHNTLFHALRKIAVAQYGFGAGSSLYRETSFLKDAGLTRQEWESFDEQTKRSYRRLFGPERPRNCMGEADYDGDQGREWMDNQEDNR